MFVLPTLSRFQSNDFDANGQYRLETVCFKVYSQATCLFKQLKMENNRFVDNISKSFADNAQDLK